MQAHHNIVSRTQSTSALLTTSPSDVDTIIGIYKHKNTNLYTPVFIGLEHYLSKIFTGRIGLSKNVLHLNTTTTNRKTLDQSTGVITGSYDQKNSSSEDDAINLKTGIGANLGNLQIDAVINTEFFFGGTYILGGNSIIPVGKISLSYKF